MRRGQSNFAGQDHDRSGARAVAKKAIENGYGAYFVRAYDLMEDLRKARAEHNLYRRLRIYLAPKVLVVDEFGIWPL